MADDPDGLVAAEAADQRAEVSDDMTDRVLPDTARRIGLTEAAQVGGDHPVTGGRNPGNDVVPELAGIGKAMQQQHDGTRAGLPHAQDNTAAGQSGISP
jgi:hypothetical protein